MTPKSDGHVLLSPSCGLRNPAPDGGLFLPREIGLRLAGNASSRS